MAALASNRYALPKAKSIKVEAVDENVEAKTVVGSRLTEQPGEASRDTESTTAKVFADAQELTGHFTFSPVGSSAVKAFPPSKEISKLFEKWGLK